MPKKKTKHAKRVRTRAVAKKASRKRRRTARRPSEAVIHQNILTDETLAYL
jgi:hypothetical protein